MMKYTKRVYTNLDDRYLTNVVLNGTQKNSFKGKVTRGEMEKMR